MIKESIFALAFFFLSDASAAQTTTLTIFGTVTEKSNHHTIENVLVNIFGTDGLYLSDTSDSSGNYSIRNIPFNKTTKYKLQFQLSGRMTEHIEVSSDTLQPDSLRINFQLNPTKIFIDYLYEHWTLTFNFLSSKLSDTLIRQLDQLVKTLNENPKLILMITGYVDEPEHRANSKNLGKLRSKAVADFLVDKGINKD